MYRFILITLFLSFVAIGSNAQNTDIRLFEQRVRETFAKTYLSAVKLTQIDCMGNDMGSGSGVVVSADGLILTVAHVNIPGGQFRVLFPDGRQAMARGLGSIYSYDAGMIQIEEEGTYPFAAIGRSANLRKGEPCIALGYAGGLKIDDPALRLGFVVSGEEPQTDERRIHTTCLMEPGDSGGPVFDLDGRVIGLRTSINMSLNRNFEVPIDVYLEYWDYLRSGKSGQNAPEDEERSSVPAPPELNPENSFIAFSDTTAVLRPYAEALPEECYTVRSTQGDSIVAAVCTPLRMDGMLARKDIRKKTYLLGKSSIVGAEPTVEVPGKGTVGALVMHRDTARDMVLLEIPIKIKHGLADLSAGVERISDSQVGTFLFSVLPDEKYRVSVAGSVPFTIKNRSRGAYLGVALDQNEYGLYFAAITENSPAQTAGIPAGRWLAGIDGIHIISTEEFAGIIHSKNAGDTLLVEYYDQDSLVSKKVTLSHRPVAVGNHIAERFEGGKSIIRDGFGHVFVHDARIHPEECGSPVADSDGRFYGINIARVSRTATLVMPVEEIKVFIQDFLREKRKAG